MTTSTIKTSTIASILRFEIKGETVIAVFESEQTCNEYITAHSPMQNTENWYDKVGLADFTKSGCQITGRSLYHTSETIVKIFEAGLKL